MKEKIETELNDKVDGGRQGLHKVGKRQHAWWCWDSDWLALGKIAQASALALCPPSSICISNLTRYINAKARR